MIFIRGFILSQESIFLVYLLLGHHIIYSTKCNGSKGFDIYIWFCYHKNNIKLVSTGTIATLLLCNN